MKKKKNIYTVTRRKYKNYQSNHDNQIFKIEYSKNYKNTRITSKIKTNKKKQNKRLIIVIERSAEVSV